jgi:peptide/nickel transport system permease protein
MSAGLSARRTAGATILATLAVVAIFGPSVETGVYGTDVGAILERPSAEHWLGTDEVGRDALARTLMGLRVSLAVALLGTLAAGSVGVVLGLWAGLGGRWADAIVQRSSEVLIAIPKLPVFLLWAAVDVRALGFEPSLATQVGQLTVAFMLLSWVTMARVVRAAALRLRAAPFVEAARALGLGEGAVARRHVLPHLSGPVGVTLALDFGDILLVETGLSFLGLGIQPPTPSLGALLSRGVEYVIAAPWLIWAPGLLTMALVLAAHLLADAAVAEDDRVR